MELQCCVIDSIETYLDTHVIDLNTRVSLEVFVSDWDQESIDAFMFSLDVSLSKD
jgi:hypothetical protein